MLLLDYYRAVLAQIGMLLAGGHWLVLVVWVLAILIGIMLFYVVLGYVSEKLFSPFGSAGGGKGILGLLVPVVIVGILASIALPTFMQYKSRAQAAEVAAAVQVLAAGESGIQMYWFDNQKMPESLDQIGVAPPDPQSALSLSMGSGGDLIVAFNSPQELAGKTITLHFEPQSSTWFCATDLDPALLPANLPEVCNLSEQAPAPDQQTPPAPDQQAPPAATQSGPAAGPPPPSG